MCPVRLQLSQVGNAMGWSKTAGKLREILFYFIEIFTLIKIDLLWLIQKNPNQDMLKSRSVLMPRPNCHGFEILNLVKQIKRSVILSPLGSQK